jgi:hypothetical protein
MAQRLAIVVTSNEKDSADALAAAIGWGCENFTVVLSPEGAAPASHFGLSANAEAAESGLWQGNVEDWPAELGAEALRLPPALALAVGSAEVSAITQFEALCARLGLVRVEDESAAAAELKAQEE